MAKFGAENAAARGTAERPSVEAVAQPGGIETPPAETERRAGGAPATARAAMHEAARGYRRVFACATGSSDSPDEERTSVTRVGAD